MAKKSSNGSKGGGSRASGDRIPDALREAGRRAAELASNPVARGMLIATLATAAAALATNKNIRESAKKNARKAQSAAEAAADAAADSANRIGAAMIVVGLLISSALMARVNDGVSLVGFALASLIGLYMLWKIARTPGEL